MLIFITDYIKAFLFYSKPRGIPVEAHRPAVTSFLYRICEYGGGCVIGKPAGGNQVGCILYLNYL
jgi:hypothetical protein